jgi:Tfp pilus assembly protein PilE
LGTQQILLIILAVIIVGVAVAVGVTMFNNQAYNSNKQAVSAELTNYATVLIQYWKTPASMGGAGQIVGNVTVARTAAFLGFSNVTPYNITTDSGEYRITDVTGTVVGMKGLGKEQRSGTKPLISTSVDLSNNDITTSIGSAVGF